MAYGKFTRGFKSGGFFGGFALSPDELDPYDEEVVYAYEVGFKTTWLEQSLRVNGAVYYYDYQDVQGFTQEFNDISAALNSMVETNVLPRLPQVATVGSRIQFVGCVEVGDEDMDLKPLKLVPIEVKAD